jgi:TATA-binding protein-associated factor Taf7
LKRRHARGERWDIYKEERVVVCAKLSGKVQTHRETASNTVVDSKQTYKIFRVTTLRAATVLVYWETSALKIGEVEANQELADGVGPTRWRISATRRRKKEEVSE